MTQEAQEPSPEVEQAMNPAPVRAIAIMAAFVLVLFALIGPVPVPVTIDGRSTWVMRGTTAADLLREGRLAGTPGILWSVSGRLLAEHGGAPPAIHINGAVAGMGVRLDTGAHLDSFHGADITEQVATRTLETTPPALYRGSGPVETVEESGTPGVAEVVVGEVSGEEVSRRVIEQGKPMTIRREPAWKGRKWVALTFDDGPWKGSTDAILKQLKAAGAQATFFMVGYSVNRSPAIAKRVVAAGMEVGNHTQSHRLLAHASPAVIKSQIRRGAATIRRVLGVNTRWYRPAGGSRSAAVYREARKQHQRLVLWTVDPKDWSRPGIRVIARRVLDKVRPGSVVLMHDGGGDRSQTVAALKIVLRGLKARGYTVVTLSRLTGLPPQVTALERPFDAPGPAIIP
jgi:peptidoglycan/xylan/chitin deacetylase (PgdA/CDA1 family)